jgi:hypothetical protein
MATRTELYRDVLENLGVVAAEDNADASDVQVVAGRYATVHAVFVKERLPIWGLASDAIPEHAVMPLVDILSFRLARKFAQDPNAYRDDSRLAWRDLRRQLAGRYVSQRIRAEYF